MNCPECDGNGANDTARIGDRFEPLAPAWRKLHSKCSVLDDAHGRTQGANPKRRNAFAR